MARRTASRTQAVLLSALVVRLGLGLATLGLLGRSLDARSFGLIGLLAAGFLVAQEALDLGTSAASVRRVAQQPGAERQALADLLAWRRRVAALLIAGWLVAMLVRQALGFAAPPPWLVAAVALALATLPWTAYQMLLQSRQRYGRAMAWSLASQALFALACLAVVDRPGAVQAVALLVVTREAFQAALTRWLGRRVAGLAAGAALPQPQVGRLLSASWRLGSAALVYRVSNQAGLPLLWLLSSGAQLGAFAAAQRLLAPALEAAVLFAHPLLAFLARTGSDTATAAGHLTRADAAAQVEAHAVFMAGLGALLCVVGTEVAPGLLAGLYGSAHGQDRPAALAAMHWLLPALACAAVSQVLVAGLLAQGRDRLLLVAACSGLLAQGALAVWQVPAMGAAGQALAWLAGEAVVLAGLLAAATAGGLLRWRIAHLGTWMPALAFLALGQAADLAARPLAAALGALIALPLGAAWLWQRPALRACRLRQRALAQPSHGADAALVPPVPARSTP